MGTTYHVCVSIEGTLKRHGNALNGLLRIDGRDLSGKEVKDYLRKVRDEHGYTHYSGCSNMNSEGRCAGHQVGQSETT